MTELDWVAPDAVWWELYAASLHLAVSGLLAGTTEGFTPMEHMLAVVINLRCMTRITLTYHSTYRLRWLLMATLTMCRLLTAHQRQQIRRSVVVASPESTPTPRHLRSERSYPSR